VCPRKRRMGQTRPLHREDLKFEKRDLSNISGKTSRGAWAGGGTVMIKKRGEGVL